MIRVALLAAALLFTGSPAVVQPLKLAGGAGGTLLVADFGAGRIVRIDPRTHGRTIVARGLTRPASVTSSPGGAVYAIADEKLFRIAGARAVLVWASSGEGPTDCAAGADGVVYVSRYGDHVDRIAPDGSVSVVATGFDRPHGITLAPDGSLLVADTYAGAVRRIARDGTVTTVATGVGRPMDVAVARDGSLLVADLAGRRLLRVRGGAATVVARRLGALTGVAIAGGSVYVSAGDGPFKVARVGAHGLVTRIA